MSEEKSSPQYYYVQVENALPNDPPIQFSADVTSDDGVATTIKMVGEDGHYYWITARLFLFPTIIGTLRLKAIAMFYLFQNVWIPPMENFDHDYILWEVDPAAPAAPGPGTGGDGTEGDPFILNSEYLEIYPGYQHLAGEIKTEAPSSDDEEMLGGKRKKRKRKSRKRKRKRKTKRKIRKRKRKTKRKTKRKIKKSI